ncbi:hypothetical protein BaRGS_00021747 [Batillaria attramentaria]|uniref:Uncharacterized protein n=1 Tax=Batillaria attramentaria TaxID=370345 RepID=A0ABD0KJF8_9CAEN
MLNVALSNEATTCTISSFKDLGSVNPLPSPAHYVFSLLTDMWLCIAFSLSSRAQFHVWRHALRQETGGQLPPPGGKAAYLVSWTGV